MSIPSIPRLKPLPMLAAQMLPCRALSLGQVSFELKHSRPCYFAASCRVDGNIFLSSGGRESSHITT
jgi:hypothetical protein